MVLVGNMVTRDIRLMDGVALQIYEATQVMAKVGNEEIPLEILHEDDLLLVHPTEFTPRMQPELFDAPCTLDSDL